MASKWTGERNRIVEMLEGGMSTAAIAADYGVTPIRMYQVFAQLQVSRDASPRASLRQRAIDIASADPSRYPIDIARELGTSEGYVRQAMREAGIEPPKIVTRRQQVIAVMQERPELSIEEITRETGASRVYVMQIAREIGWEQDISRRNWMDIRNDADLW